MHVVDSLKKLFEEEPSGWLAKSLSHLDDREEVNFTFFHDNSSDSLFLHCTLSKKFEFSFSHNVEECD